MRKKWLKYLGVGLMLSLALSAGVACKDDEESTEDSGYDTETIESVITLNQTELNLKVGDKRYIVPSFEMQAGADLVYSTADDTVASVSQNGEVTALKEGSTDIVVKYGELSATCKVNVTLGGELPQIVINGVEENSLQKLAVGSCLNVNPYVWFNGGKYDDASFDYVIENNGIAEKTDDGLIAKACGETAVKIVATWRGVQNVTLERSFTLKVIANVELSVNGGLSSVIDLYSVADMGEREYTTSSPFVITAKEHTASGAVDLATDVQVVSGADFINLDGETVSSKGKAGTAIVKIVCTASTGDTFEQSIAINVLKSVGVYAEKLEFSAADGGLPLIDIFGKDENLTSAECDGETLYISEDQKCVLGLQTLSTGVTQKTITIYGENVGYELDVDAYTKIINEAADLDYFVLGNSNSQHINKEFKGYYVLGGNIDASGYVRGTSGFVSTGKVESYSTVGLTGTFDGRGYAISNLTFGEVAADFEKFDAETRKEYTYSLFGVIGGGTVKNLALENLTFDAPDAVTKGNTAAIATWVVGGTIENVYIHLNGLDYGSSTWRATAGLAYSVDNNTVLKNVIVEVEDDGSVQALINQGKTLNASYGALVGDRIPDDEILAKNWQDVYLVSDLAIAYSRVQITENDEKKTVTKITDAVNTGKAADRTLSAVKRYENIDALMADTTNAYTDFDTAVWEVGNMPAWKSLPLNRYVRATVDGEITDTITIAMTDANAAYSVGINVLGNPLTDYTLTMSGAGIALNGNTFTVLHAGSAEITITYTLGGEEYSLALQVNVTSETETYGQTVAFSAMHGELPLTDIFGENVNLVAAFQGDTLLQISADKKRVLGVQTLNEKGEIEKNAAVQTQITVYSASKGYIVHLNAYAGILTKAEDLTIFCLDNTDYATIASQSKEADKAPKKVVDGYYVLANDIDASAWAMPTQGYISTTYQSTTMPKVGFVGTFDGQGHTISNLTLGTAQQAIIDDTSGTYRSYWRSNTYSLFGIIGNGGTVKNFALTNVAFMLRNGTATMYSAVCNGLATWIAPQATLENVYVSVKGIVDYYDPNAEAKNMITNTNVATLAYGIYSGATLNNVVAEYTYSGDDVLNVTNSGAFVGRKCANDTLSTTWTNVYVISAKKLAGREANPLYAQNDTTTGVEKVTGLYQYASVSDWKQATGSDYTVFDRAYWDLTTGVPVWRN
ncbi:MAG: Ig-like domain-containing protein [Clostridia bacterium]|nr:Ig-like domain-containing protein [Clostridia bacterium]